jgi:UDPglucose 6-dehydrogenase
MSKVGIFGAGWVGLVTGACFADLGHDVVIRDVVPEKIDALRRGEVPFHEESVPDLLERNAERLLYTLDVNDVADCEFCSSASTPRRPTSDADLSRVGRSSTSSLSWRVTGVGHEATVPVGTGEKRAGPTSGPSTSAMCRT